MSAPLFTQLPRWVFILYAISVFCAFPLLWTGCITGGECRTHIDCPNTQTCLEGACINNTGSAALGVATQALSTSNATKVVITVSGANISPSIVQHLVKQNGQWKGIVSKIPVGPNRILKAEAFNGSNTLLYEGQATGVTIAKGKTASVILLLQQKTAPTSFANSVPVINSIVASANAAGPGETVSLTVSASDPDSTDILTYLWSGGGTFSSTSTPSTAWTASDNLGQQALTVTVSDQKTGKVSASISVDVQTYYARGKGKVQVHFNTWPDIRKVTASKRPINVKETIALDVIALDNDDDNLSYRWASACGGSFSATNIKSPTWTSPGSIPSGGICKLTVTAYDGRGGSNTGDITIQISAPTEANSAPLLTTAQQSTNQINKGGAVTFRVVASDPDSDNMTFTWSASTGTLGTPTTTSTTSEVVWTTSSGSCSGTITIQVKDNGTPNATTTHSFSVRCAYWAISMGGGSSDTGKGLAVDGEGNVYSTGTFTGTATFGTTTFTSLGGRDVFVTKLDSSGNLLWVTAFRGVGEDVGSMVATSSSGDVYVAGGFQGSISLGTRTFNSVGQYDVFIAKLKGRDGSVLWAQKASGPGDDYSESLTVDSNGDVYITGHAGTGTSIWGTFFLNVTRFIDPFIVKLDGNNGNFLWAKLINTTGSSVGMSITTSNTISDGSPNGTSGTGVFVSGFLAGTGTADSIGLSNTTNNGSQDVFLAHLSGSNGNFVWAKTFGSQRDDQGRGIAVKGNRIYLGGVIQAPATFGSHSLSHRGYFDSFIAQLDINGNFLWAKSAGGRTSDFLVNLRVDASGNVFATGRFAGAATFGNTRLLASQAGTFVTKLDAGGNFIYTKAGPNLKADDIAIDSNSQVYITGKLNENSATLDGISLTKGAIVWKMENP